jgi:hypothetical protein
MANRSKQPDNQSESSNATILTRGSARLNQKTITNEELEEIQNSTEARFYLEKTQLIVPPGQEPTLGLLTTAIHHVLNYKLPKPATNALRAIALLMNELEETALHQTVRDSVTTQINEMGTDLKDFVTDATRRIDEHIESKMAEISTATKTLVDSVKETFTALPSAGTNATQVAPQLDYRQALAKPPPHVDPRLAAKEGIKLRQFFLEGATRETRIGKMSAAETKKAVNQAIEKAGGEGLKARSTTRQSKEGLLVEMETDAGAAWMRTDTNARAFCEALGPGIEIKRRPYNVFAYNVSTAIDPDNGEHLKEISEANDIQDGGLIAMRWVKPPNRRDRADQRTAHLILSFSNVDDANRAILTGLTICQRRTRVSKPKKEPVRCMKCHNWNHVAWECTAQNDTCGTCGGNDHWTKDCTNQEKKHCVSCKTDDHASWSRMCPVFLKKCEDMDRRTPENNLPFFPATEAWTWSPTPPPTGYHSRVDLPPPILTRGRNQQERIQASKDMAPNGRPYERKSWNRPQPAQPDRQTPIPPLQPSDEAAPPPSTLPEQTRTDDDTNLQVTNPQNDSHA